jgi:hypothetical protein
LQFPDKAFITRTPCPDAIPNLLFFFLQFFIKQSIPGFLDLTGGRPPCQERLNITNLIK